MKTYIPRQTKLSRERVEAKLEQSLVQRLEQYCQYLESDRDYVISQALVIAFEKDHGFREWSRSRQTEKLGSQPAADPGSESKRARTA
jgi:hypothetical protein